MFYLFRVCCSINLYLFVQEVKDMLGLELRRLVTSSKLLVRSHKCSNVASPESGDYAGNVHCVLSQLRKAVDYGATMEQRFLLGVLQVCILLIFVNSYFY